MEEERQVVWLKIFLGFIVSHLRPTATRRAVLGPSRNSRVCRVSHFGFLSVCWLYIVPGVGVEPTFTYRQGRDT